MGSETKPTFLGLGAPRSGTTTLHHLLSHHPDVWVPEEKEVHFFTYNHPEVTGKEGAWDSYLKLFSPGVDHMVRGEISPSYLWVPGTAERIAERLPDARLFVILRSPVERAISDFQYSWKYGVNLTEAEAFFRQGISEVQNGKLILGPFTPSSVVWKGLYALHLAQYLAVFPPENLEVFLLEDFSKDPASVRRELLTHLGVQDRENLPVKVRNARDRRERVGVEAQELLVEFYRESVTVLEELLDRDLGIWKTVPEPPEP